MCRANARTHPWGGVVAYDRIRNSLTAKSIKRYLARRGNKAPGNVLDIGFGVGLLLKRWIAAGSNAFGIEAETLEVPIDPVVKKMHNFNSARLNRPFFPTHRLILFMPSM